MSAIEFNQILIDTVDFHYLSMCEDAAAKLRDDFEMSFLMHDDRAAHCFKNETFVEYLDRINFKYPLNPYLKKIDSGEWIYQIDIRVDQDGKPVSSLFTGIPKPVEQPWSHQRIARRQAELYEYDSESMYMNGIIPESDK